MRRRAKHTVAVMRNRFEWNITVCFLRVLVRAVFSLIGNKTVPNRLENLINFANLMTFSANYMLFAPVPKIDVPKI